MMTAILIPDLHWTSKRSLLRVGGSYSRPPEICNVPRNRWTLRICREDNRPMKHTLRGAALAAIAIASLSAQTPAPAPPVPSILAGCAYGRLTGEILQLCVFWC